MVAAVFAYIPLEREQIFCRYIHRLLGEHYVTAINYVEGGREARVMHSGH